MELRDDAKPFAFRIETFLLKIKMAKEVKTNFTFFSVDKEAGKYGPPKEEKVPEKAKLDQSSQDFTGFYSEA